MRLLYAFYRVPFALSALAVALPLSAQTKVAPVTHKAPQHASAELTGLGQASLGMPYEQFSGLFPDVRPTNLGVTYGEPGSDDTTVFFGKNQYIDNVDFYVSYGFLGDRLVLINAVRAVTVDTEPGCLDHFNEEAKTLAQKYGQFDGPPTINKSTASTGMSAVRSFPDRRLGLSIFFGKTDQEGENPTCLLTVSYVLGTPSDKKTEF